ncbi:MAG TPA: Gfo/Idh/MocA family oxidoreductase [Terriglobia bacterium]|nr:Gfo/Idh/MocA family oxidoreductase [Terriglobia bacterium]
MKKVVWGILGTARIGTRKVIPAMQRSAWIDVRAIASRSEAAARQAASELCIPRAYGSYEALLADPEIEAIYNPLPNHLHVSLTLQAAAAGKHVLCEKPIALTAEQAEQLRSAAGKVQIMEAFMVRFHPQWLRARELVRSGKIGEPRAVLVFFSYYNDDPSNIRNQAGIGGGALYDIGCYGIVLGRFLFETEPLRAVALVDRDPMLRTDRTTSALVDFGQGRQLSFTVSTQCVPYQRVQICGARGRIEIQIPFNAPQGEHTRILIDDGSTLDGKSITTEVLAPCDQYTLESEAFSRAVRSETPLPYGLDDALMNMRIVDALFRSEKSGRFEEV